MKIKNQLSILILFVFTLLFAENALASTAYPYPVDVRQKDGTIINVTMQGDERLKWAKTADGYTLVYNRRGIFEYGKLSADGDLIPSGVKARNINERDIIEISFLSTIQKGLFYSRAQITTANQLMRGGTPPTGQAVTGSRSLICILISYTDIAFTKTVTDFENLMNQVGYSADGADGSVKDFYAENSYNQLDLTIDVVGPYTLSNTQAYYGGDNASGDDQRPQDMVTEAVNLADPDVDYADYDNDGNGSVDGVYVIYAGHGEEAGGGADAIWAHKWGIPTVNLDGKSISDYATSAELRGGSGTNITRIGVISHELGHALGETDFYDTDYATGGEYPATGNWDLMAGGTWNNNGVTPAHCNPYTKVYTFGWAPVTVLSTEPSVTLWEAANYSNSFYQINTTTAGEYYIMENRQQVDFDASIPGHGLVIFHKHSSLSGMNTTAPQKFYPVCASAAQDPGATPASYGAVNSGGCPFPGTSNKTSFSDATTPSMLSWAGNNTSAPITNIKEDLIQQTITFCFAGTIPSVTDQPDNVSAGWGSSVSFTSTASGSPAPTVQWQRNTGSGWFNISGETSTTLNLTCITLDMSGYQYRAVFTNDCGVANSDPATLTVTPRVTTGTVTIVPNPQQYSDPATLSVVLSNAVSCGEQAATSVTFYIGTQEMGTVNLSINGSNLEASLNVLLLEPTPFGTAPTGQMAPGVHTVTAVFHGINPNFNVVDATAPLTITPEDARAYYTGACFVSTVNATSSNAVVTLAATIKDITAVTGDPAWDAYAGDIRNATISFINRDNNTIIAANVPLGLVDPNDPTVAVAAYNWNVTIAGNAQSFTIGIIIGGYYTRNSGDDNTIVTVSKPLSDFVVGGGYLVLSNSAGTKAGDAGSKSNFGFSVKFNKKGTNLQGNYNNIVRRTEGGVQHAYQIKGNQFTSLAVQKSAVGGKATFNSKANITDVTNPLAPVGIAGNCILQVKMTDSGQPGTGDSIALTIWNPAGGLWYASNWNGTKTIEQVLGGGNLKVNSNNSFRTEEEDLMLPLNSLHVYPNPTHGQFTVIFNSNDDTPCTVRMIDNLGRVAVSEVINANAGENMLEYDLNNLSNGIYYFILDVDNNHEVFTILVDNNY